jgi:dihydrofolate reductase
MGKLVFGMMQSLDGYVASASGDLLMPAPDDELHRHFNDHVRGAAGIIYGRRMYEVMRYWMTTSQAGATSNATSRHRLERCAVGLHVTLMGSRRYPSGPARSASIR